MLFDLRERHDEWMTEWMLSDCRTSVLRGPQPSWVGVRTRVALQRHSEGQETSLSRFQTT